MNSTRKTKCQSGATKCKNKEKKEAAAPSQKGAMDRFVVKKPSLGIGSRFFASHRTLVCPLDWKQLDRKIFKLTHRSPSRDFRMECMINCFPKLL